MGFGWFLINYHKKTNTKTIGCVMKIKLLLIGLLTALNTNNAVALSIEPLADIGTVLPNVKTRLDIDNLVKVRQNPNPTKLYEFDIYLHRTPDNLQLKSATVHYIDNACSYELNSLGIIGEYRPHYAYHLPNHHIKQVNERHFNVKFYDDFLMNDDYFNRGFACNWRIGQLELTFKPLSDANKSEYTAKINYPLYEKDLTMSYDDPVDLLHILIMGNKRF